MNNPKTFKLIIDQDHPFIGVRIDKALIDDIQKFDPSISRVRLQGLIEQGNVSFNDQPLNSIKAPLSVGVYTIIIPDAVDADPVAQDIPFEIVYEDSDLAVINKPAGLTVHPGAGQHDGTLVNALLHAFGASLSGIGGVKRPGIVHRLDKDTTGLMVVAKNDFTHQRLSAQFSDHTLARTYVCFVYGKPSPAKGSIKTLIARHPTNRKKMAVTKSEIHGKVAVTHFKTMQTFQNASNPAQLISLVECKLETGRTHQIRVHMSHLGHPLIGDPIYGKKNIPECWREILSNFKRQALHAKEIEFIHPRTEALIKFNTELPKDMQNLLEALQSD